MRLIASRTIANIGGYQRSWRYATLLAIALSVFAPSSLLALESSSAPTTIVTNDFCLDEDSQSHAAERKEIEALLARIESDWNAHNLEKVMGDYANDYINNDGLDKAAVTKLIEDFWKTYPDAKTASRIKEIRIEGNFATVVSRDTAVGTTATSIPDVGARGELSSVSESQLYLKKTGDTWKIIGDRIDFEKVRVAFGLAKTLNAEFSAPEQVKSGRQFSAKLEVDLPSGYTAVGSISSQPLDNPQPAPAESLRLVEGGTLERIMGANNANKNELLMATVGITDHPRTPLRGLEILTRRLNVIPASPPAIADKDGASEHK